MSSLFNSFRLHLAPNTTKAIFQDRMPHQEKLKIASAMKAIDSSQRKEISSLSQRALYYNYCPSGNDEIVKSIASIQFTFNFTDQDWNEFFRACEPLQKGLNQGMQRAILLRVAAAFPKEKWDLFQKASRLIEMKHLSVQERLAVLNCLSFIDIDDDSIFQNTRELTHGLDNKEISFLLKELIEISPESKEMVVWLAKGQIKPAMSLLERLEILHTVEAECWVSPLIRSSMNMSGNEKLQLKKTVDAISGKGTPCTTDRIDWIASTLIKDEMDIDDKVSILNAIASHRSKFNNNTDLKNFIWKIQNFITSEMNAQNRIEVIHTLANSPADQQNSIISSAHQMIANTMNAQERLHIFNAVAPLSSEVRAQIFFIPYYLFNDSMTAENRVLILNAFIELSQEIRHNFSRFAQVFKMTQPQDVIQMLSAAAFSEAGVNILLIANSIIVPEMDLQDRLTILNQIADLNPSTEELRFIKEKTSDRIQAATSALERVQILSAVCLVCFELRNGPPLSSWQIQALIDQVILQIQTDPEELNINVLIASLSFPSMPEQSASAELIVNVDQLKENPLAVLQQALQLFDTHKSFPKIRYETAAGIDAVGIDEGGITRSFMTDLVNAICHPKPPKIRQLQMIETDIGLVPKAEDARPYQGMGMLFAVALNRHRSVLLGRHFHPILFKMMHLLTQEEMNHIPPDVTSLNDIPQAIQNKLLKLYLKDELPSAFGAPGMPEEALTAAVDAFVENGTINDWMANTILVSEREEFLSERGIQQILLATFAIAKSMQQRIKAPDQWNTAKGVSSEELRLKIEGELSKEGVLAAFDLETVENQNTNWLFQWIQEASSEQLERFVYSISGAPVVLPNQTFIIRSLPASHKLPAFHTCFYIIDLPRYNNYETFKEKLELSLQNIAAGNGIGLA